MLWKMAENGNGMGRGDARPSTANPTNDVELKNLLIDLVKQQPLIYDKSHRDHFRANMRTEVFYDIGNILGIPGEYLKSMLFCQFRPVLYEMEQIGKGI